MKKYIFFFVLLIIMSSSSFSQIMFTVSMDGSQENPSVSTNASGAGFAIIENNGSRSVISLSDKGMQLSKKMIFIK